MKEIYSTAEVARMIGVDKSTLLRWLYAGKIPEPKHKTFGGVDSRVWSSSDMHRAQVYSEQNFRKRKRS